MLAGPDALVILAIVVFIFGGKRISEFGASLGKGIRDFKKGLEGDESAPKELEDKAKTKE
jgi:sec-independent protein translocase protein TatA